MTQIFPWQTEILSGLVKRWRSGQLPHALLFSGMQGVGKQQLAEYFAALLMCEQWQGQTDNTPAEPCGACQGCKLMQAGTHPDYKAVYSEEGKAIPIDTVRTISEFLALTSQLAALQVVIVSPADKMNRFSANSLLKTLEEPTSNTLLILVTDRPDSLLPTIRSRCQIVPFTRPAQGQAAQWLRDQCRGQDITVSDQQLAELLDLAGGAPLTALAYAESGALEQRESMITSLEKLARRQADPVTESQAWINVTVNQSVNWLMHWTMDMIRLKSGAIPVDKTTDSIRPRLNLLSEKIHLHNLFGYLDKLTESRRMLDTQVNQQLMIEDLLIGWTRLNRI